MILNFRNKIIFSIFLSILSHFIFISFFFKPTKEEKIQKIYVVDLAKYKEFQAREKKIKSVLKQKKIDGGIKKEIEKKKLLKKKIIERKPVVKEKNVENKINEKKITEKKKVSVEKTKKINNAKEDKSISSINSKETQKRIIATQKKNDAKLLADKELSNYLIYLSKEINLMANNSYPRTAVKRRDQGKIISRLTIDAAGQILKINILTKKPKSLASAAEKILKKKKQFLKPPQILFKVKKFITVEVPINYVLR